MRCCLFVVAPVLLTVCASAVSAQGAEEKENKMPRAGLIGLDTSHVVAFTGQINSADDGPMGKVKVVAAYRGGSPDLPISANRIDGFTKTLQEKHGIEIVDSIDELLKRVDVVLLESVDGRPHLKQARPVIQAGKPLFIDKPIAASLEDVIEIYELAAKHKVPCFSSSSLRFREELQSLRGGNEEIGDIVRCDVGGSLSALPGHPELAFYGIHGIEMLFTVMGPGCETVTWQEDGLVNGVWKDGRIGTFRKGPNVVEVTGTKGTTQCGGGNYGALLTAMCTFFETGEPPVQPEETINLFAFIVAAQKSKDNGNVPVAIREVMTEARGVITERNKAR
jgi:predicted dehydrogenase